MAEIVKTFIPFSGQSGNLIFTAATGTDYFVCDNADQRMTLMIKNGNAQNVTVTLKAGDGELSLLGDAVFTVGANTSAAVPISRVGSSRIKILSGSDSGKVMVSTAVDSGGSLGSVGLAVLSVE